MSETERIVIFDARDVRTYTRCLGQVRWNKGVLEQAWEIKRIRGEHIIDMSTEWRPVPEAENND